MENANGRSPCQDGTAGLPPRTLTSIYVATPAWANRNKEAIDGLRAASEEGIEFISKDEAQARLILTRSLRVAPEVYADVPLPPYGVRVVPTQIETFIGIAQDQQFIRTRIDPQKLIFP